VKTVSSKNSDPKEGTRSPTILAHPDISTSTLVFVLDKQSVVAYTYADPEAHLHTFRRFLTPFPLLDLNEPIMERFAEIRAYLRRRGELISDFDILIGATAVYYDLTVLTYNMRHFTRIPDLKLSTHPA
jgi:predicted nucleic acid-binding protein